MPNFIRNIKNFDIFAENPKLNYKGDRYKTYWGATVSILLFIPLAAYVIYLLVIMLERSTTYLNVKSFVRDVSQEETAHFPLETGFDFALTIKYHDYRHLEDLKELVQNKTLALRAYQVDIIAPDEVGGQELNENSKT